MHICYQIHLRSQRFRTSRLFQRQPWCSPYPFRKILKNRLVLPSRLTSEWLGSSSSLLLTNSFWRPFTSTILSMQLMKNGWIWCTPCWLRCSPCHKLLLPRRIRDTYIPRLEEVGLWNLPVEEKVKEKSFQNQQKGLPIEDIKTMSQTFQPEKVYSLPRYINLFLNVIYR